MPSRGEKPHTQFEAIKESHMSKLVYRVQDAQGRGPWRPGFSEKWVTFRNDLENLPPFYLENPDALNSLPPNMHYGCGCTTLERLRRWILKEEYETLLAHSFRCVALVVDAMVETPTQVLFARALPLTDGATVIRLYD